MSNYGSRTPFDDPELSAADYVLTMFECTDAKGVLYMPTSPGIEDDLESEWCRRLRLSFSEKKAQAAADWADEAVIYCKEAGEKLGGFRATEREAKAALSRGAYAFWKKYLAPMRAERHAWATCPDIFDDIYYSRYVSCGEKLLAGGTLTDEELDAVRSFTRDETREDARKISLWFSDMLGECRARVGAGLFPRELMNCARTLASLREGVDRASTERELAAVYVMHKYGRKYEKRPKSELLAVDYDEIADSFYRPVKNKNGAKSLAPLYVYLILKEGSRYDRPLKQKTICDELNFSYGISIERKAVARIINALCEQDLGVVKTPEGVYID